MATHSSILAWRIPWTEEPGGLQSMGSQRVRHDWAAKYSMSCVCMYIVTCIYGLSYILCVIHMASQLYVH